MTISSITTGITEENALINATIDNSTIGVNTPSTGNFTVVSAQTINTGTLRTSAPIIVSAAGTAQATAAAISATVGITRLQGVTDGQSTGFLLPAPGANIGIENLIINEGISANLWPSVGCSINGATANTVFPLLTKTPYYVTYVTTSAYWVK